MEYQVTGSGGKSYTVTYDTKDEYYSCTCPDFMYRCKDNNTMCKHIMKVKKIDDRYREELENENITLKLPDEIPPGLDTLEEGVLEDIISRTRKKLDETKSRAKTLAIFLVSAFKELYPEEVE